MELTISASSGFICLWATTRRPPEQTFSVIVRSVAEGSLKREICTGTASGVRLSRRPDREGML